MQKHRCMQPPFKSIFVALSLLIPVVCLSADHEDELSLDAFIPILGNTTASDLTLVKEINDLHVFDPEQLENETPGTTPAVTPQVRTIWDKMRAARRLPLTVNSQVEKQKQQYIEHKLWVNLLLQRAEPYLQFIVNRLESRGLPLDLALLPAIESGFRPDAVSPLKAAGLWQIVPTTAGEIGLKQTRWFDGRLDLVQSTRAALDYISYLNAEFNGDWELTLAAYNAGPGRVKSALRRNARENIPGDFWSLKLPTETRNYLPKVAALLELIHAPDSPVTLPLIGISPILIKVELGKRISLERAAELAELPFGDLRKLNAGLRKSVTPPEGPHSLLLPITQVETLRKNLRNDSQKRLFDVPETHVVAEGDSVSAIAARYGLSQTAIRQLNGLNSDKILVGQRLSLRKNSPTPNPSSGQQLNYTIQNGDTLSAIARKFKVDADNITLSTGDPAQNKVLIPGKKLRIPVTVNDENG